MSVYPCSPLLRRPIKGRPVSIIQLHCKRLDVLAVQISIPIIRLSAKGTDGVMKRRCFRLKLMFAILFTGVLGILQRPWR
nr:MAG TPA: hypothetical protein [Caudoviricetes sp.]